MYHLIPIPFFFIGAIILVVCKKVEFKLFQIIAKIIIAISVITFAYLYTKYLGYDIISIVLSVLF